MKRTSNVQRPTSNVQRVAIIGVLIALRHFAAAQETTDLKAALAPLDDGVPQVAVVRLRALLGRNLPEDTRRAAMGKLVEALVRSDESEEALKLLEDPALHGISSMQFQRAQALAHLSSWAEALPFYEQVANDGGSLRAEALMGRADALRALGRRDEALQTLALLFSDPRWKTSAELHSTELLLEKKDTGGAARLLAQMNAKSTPEKKEQRFLRARLEAELGHREKAIELFRTIVEKPIGARHPVLIAALCAIADAHLELKTPAAGGDAIEDFIERHPGDSDLPKLFAKLDQLYRAERRQSRHELGRWSADPAQPRRALAQWYLARAELRVGHRENALEKLSALRGDHPALPVLAQAFIEFGELMIEDRRFDDATSILEAGRALHPPSATLARINLLAGRAQYLGKHFESAAETFEQLGKASPAFASSAFYNASLSWLQGGDKNRFLAAYEALGATGADVDSRGELLLEQGIAQAAQGDKKAGEGLKNFLRDFPTHKRRSEAWVALAELAFHAKPPRLMEAKQDLARAAENQPTEAAAERADYLMLWIEDAAAGTDDARVIALANQFLQKHSASSFTQDVRLKLAEAFYRRQDFPSAQTQFEVLARQDPNGPFAEKALFFAAESAMQSMGAQSLDHALTSLDEVVKRGGELKWTARNEQAVIERKLGKPQDALTLYDEVLSGDARPEAKREARCGKGDILYELGASDGENYRRALAIYDQIAAEANAPAHWRNQALFKKGMCLEKLEERPNALATFYKILEEEMRPDRPHEFFWFYKAGFNAARILEDDSKWQPAATIYQKLVSAGGARSEEAKSRLARLRLEHFLWDQ